MHKIWELLIRYLGIPLIEKAVSFFISEFQKWKESKIEVKKEEQRKEELSKGLENLIKAETKDEIKDSFNKLP